MVQAFKPSIQETGRSLNLRTDRNTQRNSVSEHKPKKCSVILMKPPFWASEWLPQVQVLHMHIRGGTMSSSPGCCSLLLGLRPSSTNKGTDRSAGLGLGLAFQRQVPTHQSRRPRDTTENSSVVCSMCVFSALPFFFFDYFCLIKDGSKLRPSFCLSLFSVVIMVIYHCVWQHGV